MNSILRTFFIKLAGKLSQFYFRPFYFMKYLCYRKDKVPLRQVCQLHFSLAFRDLLESLNIRYYLGSGALLGAVRQGAFAGRPKDVDFMVLMKDFEIILGLNLKGCLGSHRISRSNNTPTGRAHVEVRRLGIVVAKLEVQSLVLHSENHGNFFQVAVRAGKKIGSKYESEFFPFISEVDLNNVGTVELYGYGFATHANPEKYLEIQYGSTWRVPSSKQYAWLK